MADRHEEKDLDEAAACWCGNLSAPPCPAGKCPNAPKPETQAETVLSERCLPCDGMGCVHCGLFGTVKVEPRPSEEELAYQKWGSEPAIGPLDTRHIFSDGYQAGRASLAGELERVNVQWSSSLRSATAALEAEKARAARDCGTLALALKQARADLESQDEMLAELRAALEAEKAARATCSKMFSVTRRRVLRSMGHEDTGASWNWIESELAARQARVMPSREALARTIYETTPGSVWGDTWEAADAVLRLLAPTQAVLNPAFGPRDESEVSVFAEEARIVDAEIAASQKGSGPTGASSDPPVPVEFSRALEIVEHHMDGEGEGPSGGDVEVVFMAYAALLEKYLPFARAQERAQRFQPEARYVPSVGERAVLVASPDPRDRLGVMTILGVNDGCEPAYHWEVTSETTRSGRDQVHRDATWRRAQSLGEAKPGARVFAPSTAPETGDVERDDDGWPVQQPESDAAWLKRTVEELTTARPVEVSEDSGAFWYVRAPGRYRICFHSSVRERDGDRVRQRLEERGWPLRRNARPVETAPGVATPPRRFATPTEALACIRETIAEECHQEHPAHDAIGALETIEANLVRPEHAVTLPERFEALSKRVERQARQIDTLLGRLDALCDTTNETEEAHGKRLDELELQGRVVKRMLTGRMQHTKSDGAAWESIEREERAKAHTGADPLTKT